MTIQNLQIGWVVKLLKTPYLLLPGYDPVRRIIFSTDNQYTGTDVVNKIDSNSIMYPVINLKDKNSYEKIEDKDLVILPYCDISLYLQAKGYKTDKNLSEKQLEKISKLILGENLSVSFSPISRVTKTEQFKSQLEKIRNYCLLYCSSDVQDFEKIYAYNKKI